MLYHVFLQFVHSVPVRSCTDIQHQTELWLKVLAEALVEPLVGINLAVISLFDGKDKVDSP